MITVQRCKSIGAFAVAVFAFSCTGSHRNTATPPRLSQVQPGVYEITPEAVDQLLSLEQYPDLGLLLLRTPFTRVSDAHISMLRGWVSDGGVLWIEAPAAKEAEALRMLVPFQMQDFDFRKTSTGERGGELVMQGASNRLKINDHILTAGVQQLYVYPRYRFNGTLHAQPILEMTDTEGNHGIVIASVPVGHGLVVLDGTAREKRAMFGRFSGFDPEHPNAIRTGDTWNSYDWARLLANASSHRSVTQAAQRNSLSP